MLKTKLRISPSSSITPSLQVLGALSIKKECTVPVFMNSSDVIFLPSLTEVQSASIVRYSCSAHYETC